MIGRHPCLNTKVRNLDSNLPGAGLLHIRFGWGLSTGSQFQYPGNATSHESRHSYGAFSC